MPDDGSGRLSWDGLPGFRAWGDAGSAGGHGNAERGKTH